jgi:3-hydroxyisobutyrate dehydrogenase
MTSPETDLTPAHYNDLNAARDEAFALITQGVKDRNCAFHTPVLATIGVDGGPAARIVVLRRFDGVARTLSIHTDQRSSKVAELAANPRAAVTFYDPGLKIQVRLTGSAQVHFGNEDAVARETWARVAAFSRRCYLGMPPGSSSDAPTSGLTPDLDGRAPTLSESEPGFDHFAVIRVCFNSLDWVYLCAKGHRRAGFTWDEDSAEKAGWLAP